MTLTPTEALTWIERIIAVAVVLQTIEILQIRGAWKEDGIWSWQVIRKEFDAFPPGVRQLLEWFLRYPNFLYLLWARMACATLILADAHWSAMLFLFLSTLLISMRWRGTFNGGSDCMTLVVLSSLCVSALFSGSEKAANACLAYIAVQACLSYFVAGWVKLKERDWRGGRALSGFLLSTHYDVPEAIRKAIGSPRIAWAASWTVIVFECSFPLALLNPEICSVFIGLALIFHLANVYVFGLNRFLFAWSAAYPALFYFSGLSGKGQP